MKLYAIDFGTSTTVLAEVTPAGAQVISLMPEGSKDLFKSDVYKAPDGSFHAGSIPAGGGEQLSSVKAWEPSDKNWSMWMPAVTSVFKEVISRAKTLGVDLTASNVQVRLGCPASWGLEKRDALKKAASDAGLEVYLGILTDEAVAVALPWLEVNQNRVGKDDRVIVIDMGGGTTDIAILKFHETGEELFLRPVVLASEATKFAGDFVDYAISKAFRTKTGCSSDLRINNDSELTKRALLTSNSRVVMESNKLKAEISLSDIEADLSTLFDEVSATVLTAEFYADMIEPGLLTPERVDLLLKTYKQGIGIQSSPHDSMFNPLSPKNPNIRRDFFTVTSEHLAFAKWKSSQAKDYKGTHLVLVGGMSLFAPVQEFVRKRFPNATIYLGSSELAKADNLAENQQKYVAVGLMEISAAETLKLDRPNFGLSIIDEKGKHIADIVKPYETLSKDWPRNDGSSFGTSMDYQIRYAYDYVHRMADPVLAEDMTAPVRKIWANSNVPSNGRGKIVARTPSGQAIKLRLIDVESQLAKIVDGIDVFFEGTDFRALLNQNGFIVVFDGKGTKWGLGAGFTGLIAQGSNKSLVMDMLLLTNPVGSGPQLGEKDSLPSGNAGRI